jgi:hypothetical protein
MDDPDLAWTTAKRLYDEGIITFDELEQYRPKFVPYEPLKPRRIVPKNVPLRAQLDHILKVTS